jgi:cell division protein FtsL
MVVAVLMFVAGIVLAHGEAVQVMGTVTTISDKSITVQTVDKKSSAVEITAQTKFVKSGVAASIKDLKVGERVVINAGKIGEKLEAHQVRFGPTNQPAPAQQSKTQTLTGVVSDAMCGTTHTMKTMSAADCTRMCAKQGGYALVVGNDVYKLQGHAADLDKLAAQTVTVKGAVNGKTVIVESVAAAKRG